MAPKKRKSSLWQFFTIIDETFAQCDLCKKLMSHRTSISNLRKHLRRIHPSTNCKPIDNKNTLSAADHQPGEETSFLDEYVIQNNGNVSNQKLLNDSIPSMLGSLAAGAERNVTSTLMTSPSTSMTIKPETKNSAMKNLQLQAFYKSKFGKFNMKLIYLFVKDFQPYRIVEDTGFQELVTFLSPTYQLPSKHLLSKSIIPELYNKCLLIAKESIKSGDVFCITLEMWTSVNSDSFLSLTAHFVNEEYKLTSLLLECCTVTFARNSENFAYEIKRIVMDWGIEDKIQFVVSENDHNIQTAVSDMLGYEHFNCFADTLSTVVREAIGSQEVFKLIEKISGVVTYFKRSPELQEKLASYQKEAGEANIRLKQVSDMRCFRSIYFMLDKFVKLESSMKSMADVIDDDVATLTNDEWKMATQLCQVLRPFESVITTISSEKYCPASIVIPVINGLYSVCDNLIKKSFTEPISKAVLDVKEAINSHWNNVESSATLSVCTFLDPRFKDLAFSNKESSNRAKDVVITALTTSNDDKLNSSAQPEEVVEEELTVWHVFDQAVAENRSKSDNSANKTTDDELSVWSTFDNTVALSKPKMSASNQALAEIHRYLEGEILPRKENPLEWWKENKMFFPQLAALARSQLCAVSMSVPCERVFTRSGNHLTERRNRLNERNTRMLVFLNGNM